MIFLESNSVVFRTLFAWGAPQGCIMKILHEQLAICVSHLFELSLNATNYTCSILMRAHNEIYSKLIRFCILYVYIVMFYILLFFYLVILLVWISTIYIQKNYCINTLRGTSINHTLTYPTFTFSRWGHSNFSSYNIQNLINLE